MSFAFYVSDSLISRLGLNLLGLMPLFSLTNVWEITNLFGLSIRLIDVLFVLLWVIWLQYTLLHGKIHRGVLLFLGIVVLFFAVSFVGLAYLPNYQVQWAPLLRFAQTLLWGGLALSFIRKNRDLNIISRNVIVAGSVLSLYSVYLHFTVHGLHRIAGFFSAAGGEGFGRQVSFNEIGALYALAAVLALNYLFSSKKNSQRGKSTVLVIGFSLNIIGLILVQSRSAFLALVIGAFALILPYLKKFLISGKISRKVINFSVGILAVGAGIIVSSAYWLPTDRIMRTFLSESNEYVSLTVRFVLWRKGIQAWLNSIPNFLMGYGFRSSSRLIGAESSHNFFLNIALWFGLGGLILIVILLIWPMMKVTRETSEHVVVGTAIAAVSVALTVSMFGNVLVDPFYGGCTFLILYGSVSASLLSRSRAK